MARDRVKSKGRRDRGTFIALPKAIINSPEFARLSAYAVKLFVDLYVQFNGRNNGDLCACWRLMEVRGWRSKATLHRARRELCDRGFIIVARQGGRNKPTLYALTCLAVDECGGKLDIPATITPVGGWRENSFCTSYVGQVDPVAVPS